MDAASITALVTGITALVSAVGGLVALFRHQNGPQHQPPASTAVDSSGPGATPPVA